MRISDWSSDVCSSDLGPSARAERDCRPPKKRSGKSGTPTRIRPTSAGSHAGQPEIRRCRADARGNRHDRRSKAGRGPCRTAAGWQVRSEEHTSELQSLMRISYAVFCLKKKKKKNRQSKMKEKRD